MVAFVNKPTRVTNHSSTLLDHLYTNAIKSEIDVGILQVNLTDHFPLVAKIKDYTPVKIEHDRIKIRKSSNADSEQFVIDLESYLDNKDKSCVSLHPDLVLKDVITALNIVIDSHMPLVTLSRKRSRLYIKPWITKGIQVSILHRDKLYKKYLQNKNEQNFTIYKTYRNKLTHLKDLSRQKLL